jgi:hypothetical protein
VAVFFALESIAVLLGVFGGSEASIRKGIKEPFFKAFTSSISRKSDSSVSTLGAHIPC